MPSPLRLLATFSILATLCLNACVDPNVEPVSVQLGGALDTIAVGPNLRLASERLREVPGLAKPVPTRCSEPSPDVVIAFTRTFSGSANFSEPSGPSVGGQATSGLAEAASTLEGRTAGVLALRDGLSAACQAYVNGVIGQNAYALILSQYGNLLVALAGTEAAGSAAPRSTARETAITALLISCISEHDPTRLGGATVNPLLTRDRCAKLMDGITGGRLMRSTTMPEGASQPKFGLRQLDHTNAQLKEASEERV